MSDQIKVFPNQVMPFQPIIINPEICIGCNNCVDACHTDLLIPNPEQGKPPIICYPDECWFDGSCVEYCPVPGAIKLQHPLHQRIGWKRKDTGEYFRIGMKNPPPPNTRPPIGC